jgi:hypothetical protein
MIIVMIVIGALAVNANINAMFNAPTPEELNVMYSDRPTLIAALSKKGVK